MWVSELNSFEFYSYKFLDVKSRDIICKHLHSPLFHSKPMETNNCSLIFLSYTVHTPFVALCIVQSRCSINVEWMMVKSLWEQAFVGLAKGKMVLNMTISCLPTFISYTDNEILVLTVCFVFLLCLFWPCLEWWRFSKYLLNWAKVSRRRQNKIGCYWL